MRTTQLSKIVSKRIERAIDYAAPSDVISLLHEYARKYSLPIFEMLRILAQGNVQSVSFTKDAPHFRFYARANGTETTIKINVGRTAHEVPLNLSLIPTLERLSSSDD